MKESTDCQVFHDQLEALAQERLAGEHRDLLLGHAAACATCAAALEAHRALLPTLEELEKEVPDAWVRDMWPAVQRRLAATPPAGRQARSAPAGWRRPAVVLPWAVAASLALWIVLPQRPGAPAPLPDGTASAASARPARSGGGAAGLRAARVLRSLTPDPDGNVELAALRSALDDFPPDAVVLTPDRVRALLGRRGPWRPLWAAAAAGRLSPDDPVTVADLERILDTMPRTADATIPVRRVEALFE